MADTAKREREAGEGEPDGKRGVPGSGAAHHEVPPKDVTSKERLARGTDIYTEVETPFVFREPGPFPTVECKKHPDLKMKALVWHGKKDVRVEEVPKPMITDPDDCILRVTASTVCGSDLHLYHKEFDRLEKGDVLGHEFMGIVEEVGPECKTLQVGDRIVVAFGISCGNCWYCKERFPTACENTNPSEIMETLYGHRSAGIYGYSHLTGGYWGGQAEYVRVIHPDCNTLKVPATLTDEQALFLSDIVCTGYHATELGSVKPGQTVAIWGQGPVGLMATMWSKFRGAGKIIVLDGNPERLELARSRFGALTINYRNEKSIDRLWELAPGGPDVCIDATGFRFSKGLLHKVMRATMMETDTPETLYDCIKVCRKYGIVSVVADYYNFANAFPIGPLMEKGLSLRCGQATAQRYWHDLIKHIESGEVDPTFLITHRMPLEEIDKAYDMFDKKKDEMIKVFITTKFSANPAPPSST